MRRFLKSMGAGFLLISLLCCYTASARAEGDPAFFYRVYKSAVYAEDRMNGEESLELFTGEEESPAEEETSAETEFPAEEEPSTEADLYAETETPAAQEEQSSEEDSIQLVWNEFSKYIFVGDSRTVGMQMSVPANGEDRWSCAESMGYSWMVNTGIPAVEDEITEGTAIFILLGVNDLGNVYSYIDYVNSRVMDWEAKGAKTFFVSVGPVGRTTVTNTQIESFNNTVRSNIWSYYIDLYSALQQNGFATQDGLHYTSGTYVYIYNYLKEQAILMTN